MMGLVIRLLLPVAMDVISRGIKQMPEHTNKAIQKHTEKLRKKEEKNGR